MERQVIEADQEVIITNIYSFFHFRGHNNDPLVLEEKKGALNGIMPRPCGPS